MPLTDFSLILHLIVAGVCASFYWKVAELEEGSSPLLWAILSAMVFALLWLVLGLGWGWVILGQVGVGVSIGIFRTVIALRDEREKKA